MRRLGDACNEVGSSLRAILQHIFSSRPPPPPPPATTAAVGGKAEKEEGTKKEEEDILHHSPPLTENKNNPSPSSSSSSSSFSSSITTSSLPLLCTQAAHLWYQHAHSCFTTANDSHNTALVSLNLLGICKLAASSSLPPSSSSSLSLPYSIPPSSSLPFSALSELERKEWWWAEAVRHGEEAHARLGEGGREGGGERGGAMQEEEGEKKGTKAKKKQKKKEKEERKIKREGENESKIKKEEEKEGDKTTKKNPEDKNDDEEKNEEQQQQQRQQQQRHPSTQALADVITSELAMVHLMTGVGRRHALLPSLPPSPSSLLPLPSPLTTTQETSILLPLTHALALYSRLPGKQAEAQAAATHYQLGSFYTRIWTGQREKKAARAKLGNTLTHYNQAFAFFYQQQKEGRGREGGREGGRTLWLIVMDLAGLLEAVGAMEGGREGGSGGGGVCLRQALECLLKARCVFTDDEEGRGERRFVPSLTQKEELRARLARCLLGLLKEGGREGGRRVGEERNLKEMYRVALQTADKEEGLGREEMEKLWMLYFD